MQWLVPDGWDGVTPLEPWEGTIDEAQREHPKDALFSDSIVVPLRNPADFFAPSSEVLARLRAAIDPGSVLVRRTGPGEYHHIVCLPLDDGPGPVMQVLVVDALYTRVRCTRCGRVARFPHGSINTVPCQECKGTGRVLVS